MFFLVYELWHWNFFTQIWKWKYFKSDFICAQKINTNTNTATAKKKTVPISGILCHSFNAIIASLTPTITRKLLPRNLLITYFLLSLSFRFFCQERYKTDMSVAIQLLQCKPDSFVSPKLSSVSLSLFFSLSNSNGGKGAFKTCKTMNRPSVAASEHLHLEIL